MISLAFAAWWVTRPVRAPRREEPQTLPVLLFENGVLQHASDAALSALPIAIGAHDWDDLRDILLSRFPSFPRCPHPNSVGNTTVFAAQGFGGARSEINIMWRRNTVRMTFSETDPSFSNLAQTTEADLQELERLRQISATMECPSWKTDPQNRLIWSNSAYQMLRDRLVKGSDDPSVPILQMDQKSVAEPTRRLSVDVTDSSAPEWYNVTRTTLDDGVVYHASSLRAVIRAEEAQREFVQTLAKTFAHLSIGLAIFNRDRQLALFNPALMDLTGLSAGFLSPRPTIDAFFDALRENRRMPEPKNYKTWRQRINDLILDAEVGRFEETWTLDSGQTYRVKGRPHPDGAIAFLIEDISAQISLTRNFRAELELGQSLMDTFDDALAVFSRAGVMTFSNKAYDALWGFENKSAFADVTISDAVHMWKEKSAPNPMWSDLRDSVTKVAEREAWDMPVCLKGQSPMNCRVVPIASGSTMVRFSRHNLPSLVPLRNLPLSD